MAFVGFRRRTGSEDRTLIIYGMAFSFADGQSGIRDRGRG
jgi:hypothetical protein